MKYLKELILHTSEWQRRDRLLIHRLVHTLTGALVAITLLTGMPSLEAQPQDIRIIAPYGGSVTNEIARESDDGDFELNDTDAMFGLYAQWIRPGSFQGNLFFYHAPDVNYSTLWGLHSNLDLYVDLGPVRNVVFGGGLELITFAVDAGDNIEVTSPRGTSRVDDFELDNTVISPFLRAGKQFPIAAENVDAVVFPWAGAEYTIQTGDLSFTIPPQFPGSQPVGVEVDIDEADLHALVGLNARATLYRFFQVDAKYSLAFGAGNVYSRVSLMTNVFFTRNLGASWRFSYMETSAGYTQYNLLGLVAVF